VVAELAVDTNINAFDIESFFGNKHYKIKMSRRDRTEKKKQLELNEAAILGLKISRSSSVLQQVQSQSRACGDLKYH